MYDIIKLDFAFTFQIRDYLIIIARAYIMFLLFSRKLRYYSRKFKAKNIALSTFAIFKSLYVYFFVFFYKNYNIWYIIL